jgi:hypothetical protein
MLSYAEVPGCCVNSNRSPAWGVPQLVKNAPQRPGFQGLVFPRERLAHRVGLSAPHAPFPDDHRGHPGRSKASYSRACGFPQAIPDRVGQKTPLTGFLSRPRGCEPIGTVPPTDWPPRLLRQLIAAAPAWGSADALRLAAGSALAYAPERRSGMVEMLMSWAADSAR